MSKPLFKRVRRFVHGWTTKPLTEITPETSLYIDIGLDLEKAETFFAEFAAEFQVDLEGMDLRPYFDPQSVIVGGGDIAGMLWNLFLWSERHRSFGVKPMFVSDLLNLAQARRWCL
jgi:hypothetical protein